MQRGIKSKKLCFIIHHCSFGFDWTQPKNSLSKMISRLKYNPVLRKTCNYWERNYFLETFMSPERKKM